MEPRKEVDDGRPTVADLQGESPFAQLAKKHWLKPGKKAAKVKIKPQVLKKEIWDVLEQEGFSYKTLLVLENLQILERYAHQQALCLPILIILQLPMAWVFGRCIQSPCAPDRFDF